MTDKTVPLKQKNQDIEKQPSVYLEVLTDGVYEQREYQGEKRDCWVQQSDVYLGGRYPAELDITVYDESKQLEKGFYKLPLDDFIQVTDKKRLTVQDKFSIARKLQKV